jgi:hypothetical protein
MREFIHADGIAVLSVHSASPQFSNSSLLSCETTPCPTLRNQPHQCIIPEASVKSNFALVGDARGCCHPLTASGITAAVKGALILRDSIRVFRRLFWQSVDRLGGDAGNRADFAD